jgi:hypothetical protein
MNIIGAGLNSRKKQVLMQFIRSRHQLSREERQSSVFSPEHHAEAKQSRLFAAWLVGCQIALDRPIYFFAGVIALAFTLGDVILNLIR